MDYFIFKGIDSRSIKNLIVTSLPPISKPEMKVEKIEIDGRDGDIINELGYRSYEKSIKLFATGEIDIDYLLSWLKGSGKLIISNESDKYYNANISSKIDVERLIKYKEIDIKFNIQPFKYLNNENYKVAEKGEKNGTDITIDDGYGITEFKIEGNTEQEITTKSENTLDPSFLNNATVNGITLTKTINGTYLLNGTATEKANFTGVFKKVLRDDNNQYSFRIHRISGTTSGSVLCYIWNNDYSKYKSPQINASASLGRTGLEANVDYNRFTLSVSKGVTLANCEIGISYQLATNDNWNKFIPSIPSPDYPSKINNVKGIRNLLINEINSTAVEEFDNNTITFKGGLAVAWYGYVGKANLKANTTYTISVNAPMIYGRLGFSNSKSALPSSSSKPDFYDDGTPFYGSIINSNDRNNYTFKSNIDQEVYLWFCSDLNNSYNTKFTISILLEEGETISRYVPEGSWLPLTVKGKNILKLNPRFGRDRIITKVSDSEYIVKNNNASAPIQPIVEELTGKITNGKYTITNYSDLTLYVQFTSSDYSHAITKNRSYTFEYDGNSYLRLLFAIQNSNTTYTYKVQLEKGNTVTDYESYKEQITLIDMNKYDDLGNIIGHHELAKIGDVKDTLDIVDGKVSIIKNTGKVVLDGTMISFAGKSGQNNFFVTDEISNMLKPETNNDAIKCLATHFKGGWSTNALYSNGNNIGISVRTNGSIGVGFGNSSGIDTLEKANNWLLNNPVIEYYPLATTEIIELPSVNIPLYEDTNHISIISEVQPSNVNIKYLKHFNIENKGLEDSKPIIHITGVGTIELKVNSQLYFTYTFPENENEVYIDCEKQDAYFNEKLKNSNMLGNFPALKSGNNKIEWTGIINNIEILPKSRWL